MNSTNPTDKVWEEFSDRLRRFIQKHVPSAADTGDILQDTFVKIHKNLPHLRQIEKLTSWVFQIARNTISDYYRHRKDSPDLPEDLSDSAEEFDQDLTSEVASCLRPMVEELPNSYREAIELVEYGGITQQTLAKRLGLSPSGAKSRVQRARAKLKEMFLECCHFELDRRGNIMDYQPKDSACRYCSSEAAKKS